MANSKESNFEKMSDKELDAELSSVAVLDKEPNIDSMSDEELDAALSKASEPEDAVKLSFPEKIADFMLQGGIKEGKQTISEMASGSQGDKAQKLAQGAMAFQSSMKTIGELGQSVMVGNMAAKIMSQVPAVANVLGKQKVVQGLVTSAESRAANAGVRLTNIQRAAQRYAIEGAVAAQPFDYETIGDRIKSTAIASIIAPMVGLSFEATAGAFTKMGRTLNKFKSSIEGGVKETASGSLRDPRLPAIGRIRDSMQEAEEQGKEIAGAFKKSKEIVEETGSTVTSQVKERAEGFRASVTSEAKSKAFKVKQSLKESERQINRSIDDTDKLLSVESDIAAKTYQKKITSFFRENSEIYGKELDSISDSIAETGRMTRQEAFNVLDQTTKRSASEAEVLDGNVLSEIKKLIQDKYNPATNVSDPTTGTIYRDMNELIPFKEFLKDVRGIWSKVYKDANRMTQDEIPAAILQSEFGELVSRLPGGEYFQSLQSSYRPVISYMNKANSVLQPYKGEAFTKTAELLVKRYAKGTAAEADKHLINFMEAGTERFAKGMGAISGRAKQLGENMKTLSTEMNKMGLSSEKRIMDIAQEGAIKISKINMAEKNALKIIADETDRRTYSILQEAAEQESRTWARARQLKGREMEVKNLTSRMQKIKSVSAGAIKLLAGLTSGYLVLRGGSEIVNTISKEQ